MSKSPPQDSPPPYQQLPPPAPIPSSSQTPPQNPLTAHLSSHLAALPSLIRSSQQAHLSARTAQEITLVSLLTPHITSLLHAFATRPSLPSLAELTLVPADAVPSDWSFTTSTVDNGRPRKDADEIRRLERVRVDKEAVETLFSGAKGEDEEEGEGVDWHGEGKPKARPDAYFDDWGRWGDDKDGGQGAPPEWLWFSNEELATRLAKLLQPAPTNVPAPPPPQPPVEARGPPPSRQARWGALFRSPDPLEPARKPAPVRRGTETEVGVGMTVRAEEVTFRRENEMGIWESRNGFGIVVRVRGRR
ncbi:uncharacterized protein DNG_06317 [Cephalotrichum gorgonifer]|uniref:Uncharacterized protein n=1 Tax=Cephalotrichum gorgonifer TaxID=2041049 RepID=A0AAE8N1C5_9PEZI|nr:uncharacterized protein DNG_06317 [Cephalotrichum gorgonifer]